MYTALEVAKYIINKCIELGRPISNLQLQKILYYIQGEYMCTNNGQALFEDEIEAWQYGPVVSDVYYFYNSYSASDIVTKQNNVELDEDTKQIVNPIIESKSKLSAWTLVGQTHSEAPWKETYKGINGDIISKDKLCDYFCEGL